MALTPERIDEIAGSMPGGVEGFFKGWGWYQFARAIEAEVRKDDEALIRQMLEALENSSDLVFKNPAKAEAREAAITAARNRLAPPPPTA